MNVALLGYGTVGKAFYALADGRTDLKVASVLSRRPRPELKCSVTADFEEILEDPSIGVVVEVIGGLHPAYEYVCSAMRAGKHVVTANKHLMVVYYDELVALAQQCGVSLRCTAAAAGGIPWLTAISRFARMDQIVAVAGILNGTTNYILNEMTNHGTDYEVALRQAQEIGVAEKDPTDDVEALDPRRKLVLSANLAFEVSIQEQDVPCFGIATLTKEDIRFFQAHNLICKLFNTAKRVDGGISAFVVPTLFAQTAPEVYGNVALYGQRVGKFGFSSGGTSAGAYPTGSSVLGDCLDILDGCPAFYHVTQTPACPVDNSQTLRRFYFRAEGRQYTTEPMPIEQAFAEIQALRQADPQAFMACWHEQI